MIEQQLYARAQLLAGTDDGKLMYKGACEIDKLRQELEIANAQWEAAQQKLAQAMNPPEGDNGRTKEKP